jgi:CHAD domain-containing protein
MGKGSLSKRKVKLTAKHATHRPLQPEMSTETAAVLLLRAATARFAEQLARLRPPVAPDATHQTRVALRRLRSGIEAFAPVINPDLRHDLKRRLETLFRSIGVVRDAEVLAQAAGPDHDRLQRDAVRLQRDLTAALKAGHAADLPGRLAATLDGKHWRDPAPAARRLRKSGVKVLAGQALDRAWGRLTGFGPLVSALPAEVRHDLRKRLKSFRYMAEDFAPLWPQSGLTPVLDQLGDLQEQLGCLNDLALARARGLTVDTAQEAAAMAQSDALWQALLSQPTWWRAPEPLSPAPA